MEHLSRRFFLQGLPAASLAAGFATQAVPRPQASTQLKITRFDLHKVTISKRDLLFLEVQTDGGIVGLGEGSLPARVDIVEQALRWLEERFVGVDPAGPEAHWARAYYRMSRWRAGSVLMTALSALDIALWDIEAKRLGVPVWRLLGGAIHPKIRVYYSHWDTPITPRTPEEFARRAVETQKSGWTAVKLIPRVMPSDAETIDRAVAEVAAIRGAAGRAFDICLELVERFTARSALLFAEAVAPYHPLFLEEATIRENPFAMTELAAKSPVALATGEGLLSRFEFRPLLEAKGASIIQPDVMHCGGITEFRKVASLAEVYGVEISPHMWYGPVAHVASLAVASVCRNLLIQEWDAVHDGLFQEVTGGKYPVQKDGYITLPEGPGLGIQVDFDQLKKRFPYKGKA